MENAWRVCAHGASGKWTVMREMRSVLRHLSMINGP
jgi:hypothetical protein